jgi:predicted CXXCH cytochrome family protein
VAFAAATSLSLWACSTTARYRVLNFFFDGVPPPGAASTQAAPDATELQGPIPKAARAPVIIYAHPPDRENRCGSCHDRTWGQMFRSIEDGLCATCHADIPGQARYVHGPVAVNDCLFCHHHHGTTRPKMLLDDAATLCLSCHDRDDLGEGPHHEPTDASCVSCHDPHGGQDRFFLKRTAP